MAIDSSHYYRLHWYWAGEANYRINGKLELTTIPADEWKTVEDAAKSSGTRSRRKARAARKVVEILKKYNADMEKAGAPYRY